MARTKTVDHVWASTADPANVVEPSQAKQEGGWIAEKPPFEYDNWFYNLVSGLLQDLETNGVMEWSTSTTYPLGAICFSGGKIYQSLQAANTNQDPTTETLWWEEFSGAGGGGAANGLCWPTSDATRTGAYPILVGDKQVRQLYTGTGGHTFTLDTGCKVADFVAFAANAGGGSVKVSDGTDDIVTIWPGDMTYKITWDTGRNIFDVSEV